ncbi:hypothetical protein SDC9_106797 [bioreactor metagenome]|uniref:Uncharacterized protein n=1 Tax=bioreactor metagenome TaxID=1076179 RepID=A0A645B5Q8_9ZZZZ
MILVAMFVSRKKDSGCQVDRQHQCGDGERRAPARLVHGFKRRIGGVFGDQHRQIGGRSGEIVPGITVGEERGEQQRRGFAADPGQCQQDAGGQSAAGAFADHPGGADAAQAQRQDRLAQRIRHHAEHLLGRAHDQRKHDDRQRQRSGKAGKVAGGRHQNGVDEQSDQNRRQPHQHIGGEAQGGIEPGVIPEFRERNARQYRRRHRESRRTQRNQNGADQRVGDAALADAVRLGGVGQKIPAERPSAVMENRADDPEHHADREQDRGAGEDAHQPIDEFTPEEIVVLHRSPRLLSVAWR